MTLFEKCPVLKCRWPLQSCSDRNGGEAEDAVVARGYKYGGRRRVYKKKRGKREEREREKEREEEIPGPTKTRGIENSGRRP